MKGSRSFHTRSDRQKEKTTNLAAQRQRIQINKARGTRQGKHRQTDVEPQPPLSIKAEVIRGIRTQKLTRSTKRTSSEL